MKYNKNAFNSINDRRYRNWDGYSLAYTYDFVRSIEQYLDMEDITTIFDIGSRDGCQAMEFIDWFPESTVHLFEPIKTSFDYCKNVQTINSSNVHSHNLALNNIDGDIDFYEVVGGNVGASSMLETKESGTKILGNGYQVKTRVESLRGDSFMKHNNISKVDLFWMDVQGAERYVLEGFGEALNDVKAIYTEAAVSSSYKNGTNIQDLLQYMDERGFVAIKQIGEPNSFSEFDVIFLNNKYLL